MEENDDIDFFASIKKVPPLDWLIAGWNSYADNIAVVLPAYVLVLFFTILLPLYFLKTTHSVIYFAVYFIFISLPLLAGAKIFNLSLIRNQKVSLFMLLKAFSSVKFYFRILAVSILFYMFFTAGSLCYFFPGMFVYTAFCFSEFLVIDQTKAKISLKGLFTLSGLISNGFKLKLLILFLLLLTLGTIPAPFDFTGTFKSINVALSLNSWGIVSFALVQLVFMPWINLSFASAFDKLNRRFVVSANYVIMSDEKIRETVFNALKARENGGDKNGGDAAGDGKAEAGPSAEKENGDIKKEARRGDAEDGGDSGKDGKNEGSGGKS